MIFHAMQIVCMVLSIVSVFAAYWRNSQAINQCMLRVARVTTADNVTVDDPNAPAVLDVVVYLTFAVQPITCAKFLVTLLYAYAFKAGFKIQVRARRESNDTVFGDGESGLTLLPRGCMRACTC